MKLLKALALGTVPVAGAFLCLLLWQLSGAVERFSADSTRALGQLNTALVTINRSCGSPGNIQPCGTLAEIDKLSTHTSDLIVQTQRAVQHADGVSRTEAAMLPVWNRELTQTLASVNETADTASGSLRRLTDASLPVIAAAQPVISAAQPVLADADSTMKHLDALAASPYIAASLKNIDTSTASLAESMRHTNAILADAQLEADKVTHPPKKKLGFWGGVMAGASVVHKFEPPIF